MLPVLARSVPFNQRLFLTVSIIQQSSLQINSLHQHSCSLPFLFQSSFLSKAIPAHFNPSSVCLSIPLKHSVETVLSICSQVCGKSGLQPLL